MDERPKAGMLHDDTGKMSTMRVMSFMALLASMGAGYMTLVIETAAETGFQITGAFLLAAFAPKALQKFFENAYQKKT